MASRARNPEEQRLFLGSQGRTDRAAQRAPGGGAGRGPGSVPAAVAASWCISGKAPARAAPPRQPERLRLPGLTPAARAGPGQSAEPGQPTAGPSCREFRGACARVLHRGGLCSRRRPRPTAPAAKPVGGVSTACPTWRCPVWGALDRGGNRGSEGSPV